MTHYAWMCGSSFKIKKYFYHIIFRSLKEKANYVNTNGLGGMMVWSLDGDDFRGNCGGVKYPLLRAINEGLKGVNAPAVPPAYKNVNNDVSNSLVESNNQQPAGYGPFLQGINQAPAMNNFNNQAVGYSNNMAAVNQQQQINQQVQQPNNGQAICQIEGNLADPQNRQKYYYCQQSNPGQFVKHEFQCPAGLVYNSCTKACTWPQQAQAC